jgi:hypothetical protein
MRTAAFLCFAAAISAPCRADDDFEFQMAMARLRLQKSAGREIVPVAKPVQSPAVSQWLSQPLNTGNCPCRATGGCHCQPHSLCKSGQCANHNPLLNPSLGKFGPFDIREGDTLVIGNGPPRVRRKDECDPPTAENVAGQAAGLMGSGQFAGQPKSLPVLPLQEFCPPGGWPKSQASGRVLPRLFRR